MRVVMLLGAVLLLLAGCTRVLDVSGSEWRRENASIQQVTYDEVECARDSEAKGDLPDTVVGGVADMIVLPLEDRRRGAAYDRCMLAHGYQPTSASRR